MPESESRFFNHLRIADESACNARWSGWKPGKKFRCYLCGKKFQVGDEYTQMYTNDTPNASGNPLVCGHCYRAGDAKERWIKMCEEARERFWWLWEEPYNV